MYHLDLLVREGQHFIVKCSQFPSWRYKQHGRRDELKENATDSLMQHVLDTATFQWWGWADKP